MISNYKFVDYQITKVPSNKSFTEKYYADLDKMFADLQLFDGMTISFHHHLRNGDYVANMVFDYIAKKDIKNVTVVASSIFPVHQPLVKLIENKNVIKIYTAYVSGSVATAIFDNKLAEIAVFHSHGTRASLIQSGKVVIDFAFIASPCVDKSGNITGSIGPSNCGVLGYAITDAYYAKNTIAITDYLVDKIDSYEIDGHYVDYIAQVDKIGDSAGIVSGTTQITRDPIGLKIAQKTALLIKESGLFKDGMSFQTGAGGISLAVADELKKLMLEHNVKGSFASGGITGYIVDMLHAGLFDRLYDVQCFDLIATKSIAENKKHIKLSASKYANPYDKDNIVKDLDVVILGATEIDLDYNVNVLTGSDGNIMGGSGGHSDTAQGAKLTVIVSKLVSSRISVVKDKVTTIVTPGNTVDVLVTERGIAINPIHQDLIAHLQQNTNLKIKTIAELYAEAIALTGIPKKVELSTDIVAEVMYRDFNIIDKVYARKSNKN